MEQQQEIERIKKGIENNLCLLVSHVSRDYAKPIKEEMLREVDNKIRFYLNNCENKELQTLLLLNEFLAGIMVGFRR